MIVWTDPPTDRALAEYAAASAALGIAAGMFNVKPVYSDCLTEVVKVIQGNSLRVPIDGLRSLGQFSEALRGRNPIARAARSSSNSIEPS